MGGRCRRGVGGIKDKGITLGKVFLFSSCHGVRISAGIRRGIFEKWRGRKREGSDRQEGDRGIRGEITGTTHREADTRIIPKF